ncbi:MAG: virulence-associated E family protein, partial [Candidatus Paceibacterota bacterium]
MTGANIVQSYLTQNYRIVTWPAVGDSKGPRESGWPAKTYTLDDYHDGDRVGLLTGHEISPGHFLHDVDLDWAPGASIALKILPSTGFTFGRASKRVSHCFYTIPEVLTTYRYEDIDKTCLIEIRGTKASGEIGFQTMAPPSIWSKDGKQEPLTFATHSTPAHLERANDLKQRVCLSAIGMLLAKHLGMNGFGHDARLCTVGFLLRAGLSEDDVTLLGEAMSPVTNNTEVSDVRRVVQSTTTALSDPKQKVKGGPALARIIGTTGKAVLSRINEWLGRDSDFIRNTEGIIVAKSQENIRRAIELLGHELSYNEFAAQMLIKGTHDTAPRPLEDPQWKALYLEIDREYRFQPPLEFFKMVIEDTAWQHSFHPVKQYLDALVWDQKPRLDTWLIRCAGVEDTLYTRAISAIMLIAAVRRIRQPGCKYDEMVVWESHQGADKSSAAQALCPNPDWFSDDLRLNLHAQELIEATLGKWIVEASDLAGKRKTEIEQLKAMLSRQVDGPARMAYAHFPVERPRHFILIGTTNSSAYLTDSTGGRRFWPMTVQRFNIALIKQHRDQLWAEATAREAQGESIRLREELWP